jgi:hypothetical protein
MYWLVRNEQMDANYPKHLDPIKYPELAKVQAARLPMKTIRDFMLWILATYQADHLEKIDVDDALYKYYNVDKEKLLAEYNAVQESE